MKTKKYIFQKAEYDDSTGTFKAIFATMNVKDKDDDFTLNGAFGEQRVIIAAYGHKSWQGGQDGLPVGKGRIYEDGDNAIVEGKFFLDTTAGNETYKTVKNIGDLQEWSYSLPEIDYEMREVNGERLRVLKRIKVNEVSPVLMGAGENTRLLDIKNVDTKKAFSSHSTSTDDSAWSAGKNEKKVKQGQKRAYYGKIYGWEDPDGETGVKSTYKFIHHFVGDDGTPGAASTRACSSGIAILNGARGGTNIPDADRKGLYNHLAGHLRDGGKEPPELRSIDSSGTHMPLKDHIEVLIADAAEVIERLEDVKRLRAEENRTPGESTLKRVELMKSQLSELISRLDDVQKKQGDIIMNEFLRFQQITAERRNYAITIN